jgi:hypothetical protein
MAKIVLSELNVYPIKSAAGISLQTAEVEWKGLRGDRRWMLVDDHNQFITQRTIPKMALIAVAMDAEQLLISVPGMEPLSVPYHLDGIELEVEVWGDRCRAISAGNTAQEWFSQFLGMSCQLVYLPDDSVRPVDPDYAVDHSRDQVSFADAFPFLLISEASLHDLNHRLDTPIPMNRFRPNLVVQGCDPFAEDRWRKIRIGSVVFHVVKSCSRCVIPTIEQTTAIKSQEPLKTLATYRLQNGKIMFGQNLLQANLGTLAVGDEIEIID